MKKFVLILAVLGGMAACKSDDKKASGSKMSAEEKEKAKTDTANFTSIIWPDSTYKDLGKIKQGQLVEVTFRFKNSGTKNLVIDNVSASCGCTVPEKPEQAFTPGEEGMIKAKFDSRDRPLGEALKQVYVTANTKPETSHVLSFRVEITDK